MPLLEVADRAGIGDVSASRDLLRICSIAGKMNPSSERPRTCSGTISEGDEYGYYVDSYQLVGISLVAAGNGKPGQDRAIRAFSVRATHLCEEKSVDVEKPELPLRRKTSLLLSLYEFLLRAVFSMGPDGHRLAILDEGVETVS